MFLVHSHAHTIFPIACECISILSALPCLVFSTCSKRSNNKTFRLIAREQERLIEFTAKILDRRLSTKESNTRVWVDPFCVCLSKHAQAYKYFWEREIVIDVSFIAASCYGKVRVRVRVFCSLSERATCSAHRGGNHENLLLLADCRCACVCVCVRDYVRGCLADVAILFWGVGLHCGDTAQICLCQPRGDWAEPAFNSSAFYASLSLSLSLSISVYSAINFTQCLLL